MRHQAIYNLYSDAVLINEKGIFDKNNSIVTIDEAKVLTETNRLQAEYDAQEYARQRKSEYPSVQELVVALYDTDDKSAIEAKRAAVKLKYPKPE